MRLLSPEDKFKSQAKTYNTNETIILSNDQLVWKLNGPLINPFLLIVAI